MTPESLCLPPDFQLLKDAHVFDVELMFKPGPYNKNLWWYYQRPTTGADGVLHPEGEIINPKQGLALAYTGPEMFYGGSPSGGKSAVWLMRFFQHLHENDYSALFIRKTLGELRQKDGAWDQAKRLLKGTPAADCFYERDMQLISPEGGMVQFGYCEKPEDIRRYLGGRYVHFVFDECTDIDPDGPAECYAQAKRFKGSVTPIQFGFSSNPGGPFEEYYENRFIIGGDLEHFFLEADYTDNRMIDHEDFHKQLSRLPELRRMQLLEKKWGLKKGGGILNGDWFKTVPTFPLPEYQIRAWDVAGSKKRSDGRISDETVGTLLWFNESTGQCCISEQITFRENPGMVEERIAAIMEADEKVRRTLTIEELPPGEAGKGREEQRMKRFSGHWYKMQGSVVSKEKRATLMHRPPEERALSFSCSAQAGLVVLLMDRPGISPWTSRFKAQANTFGQKNCRNDMIDSATLAFSQVKFKKQVSVIAAGHYSLVDHERVNMIGPGSVLNQLASLYRHR